MNTRCLSTRTLHLVAGVSLFGLIVAACNKQPNASMTEAPMVAPPEAALPLANAPAPPATLAPVGAALPPAPTQIRYTPLPAGERYRYIDQAYSMGQAFADTPPDYTVDYQGTRPWIWRSGNGAYRIVEQLPQGERDYYYYPGQDYPFLVRDPYYSYAYDNGALAGVYGPNGVELYGALAAQRAAEASSYYYRSRELYRAAQYQQRQSAYANAWAARRDQLMADNIAWQQQQARNADWQAWRNAHAADEARQWRQERDQRLAYAAALGLAGAAATTSSNVRSQPSPAELAQRQAAYFSNWNATKARAPTSQKMALQANPGAAPQTGTSAPSTATNNAVAPAPKTVKVQQAEAAAAQAKAAQANATQAAHSQQLAAEAAAAQAKAAQAKSAEASQAQKLAAEAKQREAAAAQAKSAQAAQAQKLAAEAKQREAAAAQAKSAQAAQAQKMAAEAKQREAAAAQAKSAQAAQAQKLAAEAKQREAAAAQAKSAQAAQAQKMAAEAKQREAAAAQTKVAESVRAQKMAAKAQQPNGDKGQQKKHGKSSPQGDNGNRTQER